MMSSLLKISQGILLLSIMTNTFATSVQSLLLPLTFEYESNPLLSTTDEKSVSRVILIPGYSITSNRGSDQWSANASLRMERSSDQTISQDRDDPSVNINWSHDYETGQFGITALWDNASTRITEFTDSGLVSGDNTRQTRTVSVNWLNSLSERTALTIAGNATHVTFDEVVLTGLVNYQYESINAKLNYKLNDLVEAFTQLSLSQYKPDDVNALETEAKSFDIGVMWTVNEKLNITASAGINETVNIDKGWQADLNMQYATPQTNSHLTITRSLLPSSTGNLTETNQATAGWTYNLTERDNIAFSLNWSENLSLNKSEAKYFSVNYSKELSLAWTLGLTAAHRSIDDKVTSIATSNSVMASIIYKLPDF